MIRVLNEADIDAVIQIVNENWKREYAAYVDPFLLTPDGCDARAAELRRDISSQRLSEYVWEEDGQVLALLSFGNTSDADKPGAFEVWRIYLAPSAQGKGLGSQLLAFAEDQAKQSGHHDIVIWAFQQNTRAVSFYQKHGYAVEKEAYLGSPYMTTGIRLVKQI